MDREHFILQVSTTTASTYHPYVVATITNRNKQGFLLTYMYQRRSDGSQRWCEGLITYHEFNKAVVCELNNKDYKRFIKTININTPIEDLVAELD